MKGVGNREFIMSVLLWLYRIVCLFSKTDCQGHADFFAATPLALLARPRFRGGIYRSCAFFIICGAQDTFISLLYVEKIIVKLYFLFPYNNVLKNARKTDSRLGALCVVKISRQKRGISVSAHVGLRFLGMLIF